MDRRCDHRGSACLHRPYPPQATRFDELPPLTFQEWMKGLFAGLLLSAMFYVIFFYGAVAAVQI